MSACEEIVKKYVKMVDGLAEMIEGGPQKRKIMGVPIQTFQPVKLVIGPQHIMGIVLRATKQTIVVVDALGNIITVKVPKITMIWKISCESFIEHMTTYRLDVYRSDEK